MAGMQPKQRKSYGTTQSMDVEGGRRVVTASFAAEKRLGNAIYPSNAIRTTKYTILTFLPKNLFEQFHRLANFYFLFIVVLNFVPQINAFGREVAMLPLLFVLSVTALKDIIEDRRRYASDREVNRRTSRVFDRVLEEYTNKRWADICVGDVVKLECNDIIPADLLILWSSESNGLCHIETANLDGETNLKQRRCPKGFHGQKSEVIVPGLDIQVKCEEPNSSIYQFNGYLEHNDRTHVSLNSSHLLLRGCVVRNTETVIGLVIYAGHDTKSMMNNSGPRYKRSKMEKAMNKDVLRCIVILLVLCVIGAIGDSVWLSHTRDYKAYLPIEESPAYDAFLRFWTFVIVFQIIIPISLYVSVEIVKLGQVFFIQNDIELYHAKSDTPAKCRALNINEDLGQIEYVFSDKTGTLTENRMVFRTCSIGGMSYGSPVGSVSTRDDDVDDVDVPTRCSSPPALQPEAVEVDSSLESILARQGEQCNASRTLAKELEFFLLMAICNTVVVAERKVTEDLSPDAFVDDVDADRRGPGDRARLYEAESPDEAALVQAAKAYGVGLKSRRADSIAVQLPGTCDPDRTVAYPLLHVLPFDSERKRMSVIVRDPIRREIVLYCKGADAVMYGLLRADLYRGGASEPLVEVTERHVGAFARQGLRTLCMAKRVLSDDEYERWLADHETAEKALVNRDDLLAESARRIERDLELMGATGVEDRLQDGVPETIQALRDAGIVVWVLTGDKQETAINVAYSSQLFDSTMELIKVNAESMDDCRHLLRIRNEQLARDDGNGVVRRGLVIDGRTLDFVFDSELKNDFLALARRCHSVICCRTAPIQKAAVVRMAKEHERVQSLAIGDGANDVSMIQTADVGVGISGNEGMQAVMASDFTLRRFRYLKRLLFVHGHWCYDRLVRLILYMMYKNAVYVFLLFWYQLFNGWSASVCIEQFYLFFYNLIFTSTPIIVVAILDQDIKAGALEANPNLYNDGRQGKKYTQLLFWLQIIDALWQSLVMFFVSYLIYADSHVGRLEFGTTQNTACIITVTIHLMLEMHYWTWVHHFFVWGSLVVYFVWALSYNAICCFPGQDNAYWVMEHTIGTSAFWLCIVLTPVIALLPRLLVYGVREIFFPSTTQIIRKRRRRERKGGLPNELGEASSEQPLQKVESPNSVKLPNVLGNSTGEC